MSIAHQIVYNYNTINLQVLKVRNSQKIQEIYIVCHGLAAITA